MFYVYEYYKVDTGEVFYVGKGTGNRINETHNRNSYFKAILNKYECAVRVYEDGLSNEEACDLERERISFFKGKGEAYCNFTAGGTGFSTGILNPIHKRIANGEESFFAREKFFGEKNGFYGKKHTKETKDKISASRTGKGGQPGKNNPMYGKGRAGKENPMYGRTAENHPNSVMYLLEGEEKPLTAKQCELRFSIAFERIRGEGGVLRYKTRSKNAKLYDGMTLHLCERTCND